MPRIPVEAAVADLTAGATLPAGPRQDGRPFTTPPQSKDGMWA